MISVTWWLLGLISAGAAIAASGALVLKHFNKVQLPGCRAGSACDKLDSHFLGGIRFPQGIAESLGFAMWPTSALGLTYFAAIAAAWLVAVRRITPGLRAMVRLGALVSLGYMVVILIEKTYCKYCIASHAANFALLASMEVGLMLAKRSRPTDVPTFRSPRRGMASLAAFVLAFAGVTGALAREELALAARGREANNRAVKEMLEKSRQTPPAGSGYDFGPKGFTGRYRTGPEVAQARIVMFGAFTCKFCKQMEQQVLQLVSANPGKVSFCFKHYPMNSGCNPHIEKGKDPEEHRNACWAARCAEACAIWAGANAALAGEDQWSAANDAFWKAHKWLYDIEGQFKDDTLIAGLKNLGFDADKVTELMTKPAANANVLKDVEEAHALGLFQTPMIFINGVELKSWQTPGELQKAVAALLAAAPAADARNDKPDLAPSKAIDDWRAEKTQTFAPDKTARTLGKADAPVKIVIFGDLQEENTRKADRIIRAWIAGPGGLAQNDAQTKPIHYTYRQFPGDQTCNEKLFKTFFEHGCLVARASEAAGLLGGDAAYWKMHDWFVNNPSPMGLDQVKKAARACGLEADAVISALSRAEVAAAIKDDIAAANAAGVTQIPMIYIQGRFVKTWTRENDNVLERIIDDVSGAAGKK